MGRFLPIASLLVVLVAAASAPAASRYSLRGNGESVLPKRADARGMGGADTALETPSISSNPASIVSATKTTFYGTFQSEWIRTEERIAGVETLERTDLSGYLPNLALIYPFPRGLRLGVGLLVDRRRRAFIERENTTSDGQPYTQTYDARGNLLVFPALLGLEVKGIQLGGGANIQLVNSKVQWRNDFPDGSVFVDSDDLEKTTLWGVAWKAGAIVPVGARLGIGGWYSSPSDLSGHLSQERNDAVDDTDDVELDLAGEIPASWSVGFSWRLLERLQILGDWTHEDWETGRRERVDDTFVSVDRYAIGAQWMPSEGKKGVRIPLRAGYRTEELHTLDARGNRVREHVITAGSGFGLAAGRGTMGIYVEYGWRGEREVTEYYEKFLRFGLTLTGKEQWGRRRRPEDDEEW